MEMLDTIPDISIVTPCLNRVDYIEAAIQSVIRQGIDRYEHIIVDGGSTDGTLDIIKKYPHVRYISEEDENLYQALNKAIRMARGRVIGHLNSDDVYPGNTFIPVLAEFQRDRGLDTVHGNVEIYEVQNGARTLINRYEDTALSLQNITVGIASTNARFFTKTAYARLGLYSEKYTIAADREFLLRAALAELTSVKLPQTVYEYLSHAGSLTISSRGGLTKIAANEYIDIAESYLQKNNRNEVAKWLNKWISQTSLTMLIAALKELDFASIWLYVTKGTRSNSFFLPGFVWHVFSGKLSRLTQLAKNKS